MHLNFYAKNNFVVLLLKTVCLPVILLLCSVYSFAQTPGTALSFDVTSGTLVNIPAATSVNISSAITLESWIYITNTSGIQDVICKSSNVVNTGYIFPRTEDGWRNVQFLLNISGYGWQKLQVPYGITKKNQWHHLAATYDGNVMSVYIDGVLAGTQLFTGAITVNNNPLVIGGHTGYGEYFSGKVDEARIWNRALSGCEIRNNLTCELPAGQTGLAAYYKLNQGLADLPNPLETTAIDASGNGNNGVLSGFILNGTIANWTTGIVSGTCTVFSPITATATAEKTTLAVGSDIKLFATGGDTYSWVGPNGFTSTLQNPVLTSVGTSASGTYVVTATKNGCSATAGVTVTVAQPAGALNFDGSSNSVIVPNNAKLNLGNTFTIETWIKPASSYPSVQNVLSKSSRTSNTGYIFPRTDDGWRSFSFWLDVNGSWRILSAQFPNLNQWNHVTATYDGYFMKIYLNGTLVGTEAANGNAIYNNNDLTLGIQDGGAEYYKGSVDETRIWSRSLTQCEIQNNMNCALNGQYVYGSNGSLISNGLASQVGLTAYYRYNQGLANSDNSTYTTLADSSGNNLNGVLQGFALNGSSSNWVSGNVNATCSPFIAAPTTVGSNGPNVEVGTTLNLFSSSGTSWSWTGPNNFTSNLQNPSIPNAGLTASGTYTVTITGANGCSSALSTNVTVAYRAGTLGFDGITSRVIVPNSPALNISKTISIESWLYPTNNVTQAQDVISKSTKLVNSGYIFPRTDDGWNSITFYLHINGAYQQLKAPYPGINQWHHVAATYDGYFMRVYVDGVLMASKEVYGTITVNSNDLVMGSQPGFGEFYAGKVDETRIWNRALNQCEIINNMNCELSAQQNNGLVAYYKYNQGFVGANNATETTLIDASGNANQGTLTGFSLTDTVSNWGQFKISGTCTLLSLPPVTAMASASIFGIGSTIQLFATGGTTYSWNGPNGFSSTSDRPVIQNAQVAASGTYTVTVPFVNCVITSSTRLSVTPLDPISASGPTTFCPSGSVTLSISSLGTYQWYRNDLPITGATASSYLATQGGNYTVTVTNSYGDMQLSAPVVITVVDNLAPVPDVVQLPTLNLSTPAQITNYPTATDNCRGRVVGTTNSPLIFNTPGTYTLTWAYDDRNGNISYQNQQVVVVLGLDTVPPVLTVPSSLTLTATITLCGAVANFTATASDNSGKPVTISYNPAPGSVFPAGNTTVTVTAVDASANTSTGTFTVTVLPTVVAAITGINTVCTGSAITLADTTPGGVWSSADINIATIDASGIVTGIHAGNTTIRYTDACGVSALFPITVKAIPAAPVVSVTDNCGSSVLAAPGINGTILWSTGETTATVTVLASGNYSVAQTVNGCTGPATSVIAAPKTIPSAPVVSVTNNCGYSILTASNIVGSILWNTGETNASITVTAANVYTVTQTVNGCTSASASITTAPKTIPSAPVVSVTNNCSSSVLTASNTIGSILWSTGETNASITVTAANAYTVTQTVNGCTSASVTITAAPKTIPSVPVVSVTNNCGSSVLTVSNTVGSILWSTGETTASITVTAAKVYTVTQTVNGCTGAAASITAAPTAIPPAPAVSVSDNCGYSLLTASNVSGSVLWSTGETTMFVNVTNTGSYGVTQTVNGCTSDLAGITATPKAVQPVPVVTVTNNCGSSIISTNVSGTLRWSNGAAGSSIVVTAPGSYSVTATNTSGCSAVSAATIVTVNQVPAVAPITGPSSVVAGTTKQLDNLTAGGVWTSSNANATVTASGLVAGVTPGNVMISYTVTSSAGCATVVTFPMTVLPSCTTPVATITASNADAFCNKLTLTGSASVANANYRWIQSGNTIATTQQLTLGLNDADGLYQLIVSYSTCTSAPVSYTYQKQNLVSSYTILANDRVKIGHNNRVVAGSIGITSLSGKAEFGKGSSVTGSGSFVKAPRINNQYGITLSNYINGMATVTMPTMQYNTASTKNLPSYTVSGNGVTTVTGNYKNLTIRKGANAIVNGSTFGTIEIEDGASIRFTSPVLNIENLLVDDGDQNDGNYSYIRFAANTSVRVSKKVSIGSQVIVNPDYNVVTFYMGDMKSDEEKFTVNGTNTKVIANIYIPGGKLQVTATDAENDDRVSCDHKEHSTGFCKHGEHDHQKCVHKAHAASDCIDNVYMTGLFIAQSLESNGNTVIWSSFDCASSALPVVYNSKPFVAVQSVTGETAAATAREEELKVTVMPNPSTSYFTLRFESKYETPLHMRVLDAAGRVVDAKTNIGSNSTIRIGANYASGMYYAEITQGARRKVIQLIKTRG